MIMNLGTFVVSAVLAGIVFLISRGMIKDKKKGKSVLGCGGDCSKCKGCH